MILDIFLFACRTKTLYTSVTFNIELIHFNKISIFFFKKNDLRNSIHRLNFDYSLRTSLSDIPERGYNLATYVFENLSLKSISISLVTPGSNVTLNMQKLVLLFGEREHVN